MGHRTTTGEMVWQPAEGGPAVTAEEWSHGDTTAEGAMVDPGGDRVTEVGEDGTVLPGTDADPDADPTTSGRRRSAPPSRWTTTPPPCPATSSAEAVLPDDEVEDLEAGMIATTTEASDIADPLELEGAPMAAEEAAVFGGPPSRWRCPTRRSRRTSTCSGCRDDDRAFDALPTDEPVLATDDPEQALAEGGDTPTLEGTDPLDGASG